MIIYNATVNTFLRDCGLIAPFQNTIAQRIKDESAKRGYPLNNTHETDAWTSSLPEVAKSLLSPLIDKDIGVAVEYKLSTSKERVDFLLYGKNNDGKMSVVIIELKQWSYTIKESKLPGHVYTFGGGGREDDYWHPSVQALHYAETIRYFDEFAYQNGVDLEACSYLHNLLYGGIIQDPVRFPVVIEAPAFISGDAKKVTDFIHKYITKPDPNLLYEIDGSRIVPSKAFSEMLASALKGNPMMTCDREQYYSITRVVEEVNDSIHTGQKKTIIIKGGPGTGKSVVAVNILGKLIHPDDGNPRAKACYLTANFTPRTVMSEDLIQNDYKKVAIKDLFKSTGMLKSVGANEYDCILVDEAHRLQSWKFGTGVKRDVNFLQKIIESSLVNVFFIDVDQKIGAEDYVTIDKIRNFAHLLGSEVIEGVNLSLTSQFRCSGGTDYISFLNDFLGYRPGLTKYHPGKYEFKVCKTPKELVEIIKKKQEKYGTGARLMAGYTHTWLSEDDPTKIDFDYGPDCLLSWNLKSIHSFANDASQLDRVGCIHTVQGVDLQYAGVIIGKDLTYREGKLCFNKEENCDPKTRIRTSPDDKAELYIRNTYKVLLTRGIQGTFVYCEDQALNDYLQSRIV